ncbi:MAG: threonylcarbamoyl-AMP synthase, partial [Actinobacteria bacterium]|nr:threonylcarbamoyl-AMP synthase [Actinomycetota bacterium]
MSQIFEVTDASHPDLMVEVVEAASTAVANGELVVIPTESSYAVICDAFNVEAVSKLRS